MPSNDRNLTLKELLPTSLLFLIVFSLPDLITWLTLPDGLIFTGAFVNIDDASVYLSAIRQGAEGSWLFTPQFTPEPLPGLLSLIPYVFIGKLQAVFGGKPIYWYQFLQMTAAILALYTLKQLVSVVFPNQARLQKTSYLLILFGSGISWLLIGWTEQIPSFSADLLTPEWNMATSFLSAPHFLLGIACQAAFFTGIIKLLESPHIKVIASLLIIGSALGLFYPFLIVVDGLALALWVLIETITTRSIPWRKIFILLITTLPMIMFLFYFGYYIPNNPTLAETLLSNNQIEPPPPLGILVGYGLLIVFSIFAVKPFIKTNSWRVVVFWIAANIISLYLPLNFSGRFILGLFIPMCLMAAYGLESEILPKLNQTLRGISFSKDRLRNILVFLTFPSTFLFLIWVVLGAKTNLGYPYYFHDEEILAVQWLAEQTTDEDLILADYPISNLIPRYSSARVFQGHLNLTIELEEKQELAQTFWDPETDNTWKSDFLEEWGVTYIYYGLLEHQHSKISNIDSGILVYDQDGIQIYRIQP